MGKSFSPNYIGVIMTETTQDQKTVAIQTIYVKDVSFEAPNSPGVFMEENIQPETKINLSNTHNKIGENSYDVSLTIKAEASYCLLYTSPSPRDRTRSRMPSSA